jgi:hypothetical protein
LTGRVPTAGIELLFFQFRARKRYNELEETTNVGLATGDCSWDKKRDGDRDDTSSMLPCIVSSNSLYPLTISFNLKVKPVPAVYGAVTTGGAWKFLRLRNTEVTLDLVEYHVESVAKILGILGHIVETG